MYYIIQGERMDNFFTKSIRIPVDQALQIEERREKLKLTFSEYVRRLVADDIDRSLDAERIFERLRDIDEALHEPSSVAVETLLLLREIASNEIVGKVHNQLKALGISAYTKGK